jgi:hypothetical protein
LVFSSGSVESVLHAAGLCVYGYPIAATFVRSQAPLIWPLEVEMSAAEIMMTQGGDSFPILGDELIELDTQEFAQIVHLIRAGALR